MFVEQSAHVASPGQSPDLVSEANHRIANSLTLICALVRQRARALRDEGEELTAVQAQELLAEIQGRLDAVGRLHRMLSMAPGELVDVGIYLQHLVRELASTLTRPDKVTLHVACELGLRAPPSTALHLAQIAVEVVVNSVKHAHPAGVPGEIRLRCHRAAQSLVVDISDDGVGLPEGLDPTHCASSGLQLIQSMASHIGGQVEFKSDSLGLRCLITVPLHTTATG